MDAHSKVRAAIEENNRRFEQAFHRGDAAGVAALYTREAYLLPPGGEIQQGRAAIAAFWQAAMESGIKEAHLETVNLDVAGEQQVREIARFVLTIQQGEERIESPGKYVIVWRQEDGEWKMEVDIWNS